VRDQVKSGAMLSDAFRRQGAFPPMYVTSVLAGEKSGSLDEVIDRYIAYQKLTLAVKKKLLVSLLYPPYCWCWFAAWWCSSSRTWSQLRATLQHDVGGPAGAHALPHRNRNHSQGYVVFLLRGWSELSCSSGYGAGGSPRRRSWTVSSCAPRCWRHLDHVPGGAVRPRDEHAAGGGIPLVQALETASDSMSSSLIRKSLDKTKRMVREGQPLSTAVRSTGIFPSLAIDMVEVGESTGALPRC